MSEKLKNLLGDILFLTIGIGMYLYASTSNFPIRSRGDVGSAYVPKLVCLLIIVLSLIKIIMILANSRMSTKKEKADNVNYVKGALVILVLAVYCFAFKTVGFPLLTPVMLYSEMLLMLPAEKRGKKAYIGLAALSVGCTAFIFVVFYYGLKLMLPAGILRYIL